MAGRARPFRFLHTADWHLGRSLAGMPLLDDQAVVVGKIAELAVARKVDAVVIAGDIYDHANAPGDAVQLFGRFVERVTIDAGISIVAIAGNHDHAGRLAPTPRLHARAGFHVYGVPDSGLQPLVLTAKSGAAVAFCPVPYLTPGETANFLRANPGAVGEETADAEPPRTHDAALRTLAAGYRARVPHGVPAVAVAHAFITGASPSESNSPLLVGGTEQVGADAFDGFAYTALGHLHEPQCAGADHIRYSGSLLKYSASEADHAKSVVIVEVSKTGAARFETVPLHPPHDLVRIAGRLDQLLAAPDSKARDAYVHVTLAEPIVPADAVHRLRELYPLLIHVRATPALAEGTAESERSLEALLQLSMLELFREFHASLRNDPLTDEETAILEEALATIPREESGS